jgi:RHH-type proline utilization regulon transcriptional repressor/proline dehydrogenase/delta 1-pyrroline-5-carboxylate dehydrogenase
VLGLLARDRARGGLRRVPATAWSKRRAASVVGPPDDPATRVGPVITADAKAKIEGYIEQGKREATLATSGAARRLARRRLLRRPAHLRRRRPGADIAQEEIFGPVLAVIKARDLDEALAIANGTSSTPSPAG